MRGPEKSQAPGSVGTRLFLIGVTAELIPPSLCHTQALRRPGSSAVWVTESNITVVAALFGRLLGKRRAYAFTLAGIGLYVLLVGADPVAVRAGVMGGLYVTAHSQSRRPIPCLGSRSYA